MEKKSAAYYERITAMNVWVHFPDRCVFCVQGPDCFSFLQGLITKDIYPLTRKKPIFTAFLTSKGFFEADFFIIPDSLIVDKVYIDCHISHFKSVHHFMRQYHVLHDVFVSDALSFYAVCCGIGSNMEDIFSSHNQAIECARGGIFFQDPRSFSMGVRALIPYVELNDPPFFMIPGSLSDYHKKRLSLGLPEGVYDLHCGKSIILEYNYQDWGFISWDKGCYRGQELMSRTWHRGMLRKKLFILSLHSNHQFPQSGSILMLHQEKAGIMASHNDQKGLACLYTDFDEEDFLLLEDEQGVSLGIKTVEAPLIENKA